MVSPKLSSAESKIYACGENAISSGLWKVTKKPPYQMNQTGFVKSTSNISLIPKHQDFTTSLSSPLQKAYLSGIRDKDHLYISLYL